MCCSCPTNTIVSKIFTGSENRKTQVICVKEIHRDIEKFYNRKEDIEDREVFRKKTAEVKDLFYKKSRREEREF